MNIRMATIEDQERWDRFVCENETGGFTQSWAWGDFLGTQNEKIWRLIVEDGARSPDCHGVPRNDRVMRGIPCNDRVMRGIPCNDSVRRGVPHNDMVAVVFFFKSLAKMGRSVLYVPRGPVINFQFSSFNFQIMEVIMKEVERIAREENAMAFQMDPYSEDKSWCEIFDKMGFQKCERDILPRHTLMLDLRTDEEVLLKQMHEKTRYNIGVAKKHGVEIVADNAGLKEFYELLKKTEERQKVRFYGARYFKELLKIPFVKLYLAKVNGKVVAGNIVVFWDNTATYLWGASDHDFRQMMSPYLLQWQAIRDAKKAGLWFYDFWGAAPVGSNGREANWAGFTKFKMGFSPNAEITEYIGTYEKIYQPIQLGFYRFLQKIFR